MASWTALVLSPVAGWLVLAFTISWLLLLLVVAIRYPAVRLSMVGIRLQAVGFFRRREILASEVSTVTSVQGTPALALGILAPQLTARSIYWIPGLVLRDDSVVWLDSMFASHAQVEDLLQELRALLAHSR